MKKIGFLIVAIFITLVIIRGYFLTTIPYKSQTVETKQITTNEFTGTLQILWDDSNPLILVSEHPFSVTLDVDIKLLQDDKILYWYGIPTYEIMNQFDNLYAPDEVGTGVFKTIGYTAPINKSTVVGNVEEWIRPTWTLVTTYPVYIESTNQLFTETLIGDWKFLDISNTQQVADEDGFFYNRDIQFDWPYRIYLPVIMKGL